MPHHPLPETPTAFRLVILNHGSFGDKIECTLRDADLSVRWPYETLSYVWGSTEETQDIILDGIEHKVTANLVSALTNLRDENTPRVLWVDALCINQSDPLERSSQVRRMMEIYKCSSRTLVWLGDPPVDFGGPRGMAGIRDVLTAAAESAQGTECAGPALQDNFDTAIAAFTLADVDWFTRVWVLQEVAVSKEVTVLCGQVSFPWTVLVDGLSAFGNAEGASHAIRLLNRWHESRLMAAKFCREYAQEDWLKQKFVTTPIPDRLLSLLLASNGLSATDPRDHVFALLGLVGSFEEQALEPRLAVDYEIPADQVLKRVARYLFESTRDPSILYGAGSTPAQLRLGTPSWVPTWQGWNGRAPHSLFHSDFERPLYRLPRDPVGDIVLSEDGNALTVRGRIKCRITKAACAVERHGEENPIEKARSLFGYWEHEILEPLEEGYRKAWTLAATEPLLLLSDDPSSLLESLREAIADTDIRGHWEETIFHETGSDEAYNGRDHLQYSILMGRESETISSEDFAFQVFATLEMGRLAGGAPFATSNGLFGFFAAADLLRECSDAQVCMLQGCITPFIIRGSPGSYTLLGPCYISPYGELEQTTPFTDLITLL